MSGGRSRHLAPPEAVTRVSPWELWPAAAAVFLSSYLTFRPLPDVMFTASDALFFLAILLSNRTGIGFRPFQGLTTLWLVSVGLMLAGLLVGSLSGGDPTRWVIVSLQYLFAWIVLPALLIGRDRRFTLALVKSVVAGVATMEIIGALVYFFYDGTYLSTRATFGLDFLTGGRRLGAFATDANWNGAAVAMTLPFVCYLYLKREIGLPYALTAAVALVLGLLLSASFTAFASAVVGVSIFLAIGAIRVSAKGWAAIAIALVIAAQSSSWLPPVFQARVGTAIETGDLNEAGTYVGRVELIRDAWRMAEDHIVVGVGADQFRVVSPLHAPVHNMYLLLWVEGGLAALIGWLGLMVVLVLSALAAFRSDRLATAMALSIVTTFLVFSTASPHMYARLWPVPVLLAVAVALDARKPSSHVHDHPLKVTRARRKLWAEPAARAPAG